MLNKIKQITLVLCIYVTLMISASASTLTITMPHEYEHPEADRLQDIVAEILETSANHIIIKDQGLGGTNVYIEPVFDAMLQAESDGKRITVVVTGRAVSFSALLVCYASDHMMLPGSSMTFHQGFYNDENGEKSYVPAYTDPYFGYCQRKGILSKHELYLIEVLHKRINVWYNNKHQVLEDWK